MSPFRVVCIDDTGRPDGIPTSKWIKKDEIYTVIQVDKIRLQGGMLGFKLAEIDLDSCFPYQYFLHKRFAPVAGPTSGQIWAEQELTRLLEEAKLVPEPL